MTRLRKNASARQAKRPRTVKSFKDLGNIEVRALRNKKGHLKPLDKKFAVSFARQIAEGFDSKKIDLRKPVSAKDYKRARLFVDAYIEASREGNTKLVRPKKQNRALYAKAVDTSSKFKVYFMPVSDESDTFKKVKIENKIFLQRVGKFSDMFSFDFSSQRKLVTKTKEETEALFKKIDKRFGKGKYAVKIRCGTAEFGALYRTRDPHIEIENWIGAYGKERVKRFCLGFNVYTFKNQVDTPPEFFKRKEKKKRRSKRDKIRMK